MQGFEIVEEPELETFSAKNLLKMLIQKRKEPVNNVRELIVMWVAPRYCTEQERYKLHNNNLLELSNVGSAYFSHPFLRAKKRAEERDIYMTVPSEIFVAKSAINELTYEHLKVFESWLELLSKYARNDVSDEEIVLGYRGSPDPYGYESYIQNRITKFVPLWDRYGLERDEGFNSKLISQDLESLTKLVFWGGKYPNMRPRALFDAFEIHVGPGSLVKNVEVLRQIVKDREGSEGQKRLDVFVQSDMQKWITVILKGIYDGVLQTAVDFVKHMLYHHCDWRTKQMTISSMKCGLCLVPPRSIETINASALYLSARYFEHLHLEGDDLVARGIADYK